MVLINAERTTGPVKTNALTAIVTGASSGIGQATARLLAQQGLQVALVARRGEKLETLQAEIESHGGQALALPADLTHENECAHTFAAVMRRFGGVDVLVNNAGFGWYGYFNAMGWELARDMLRLNIQAVVQFTALCLPEMLHHQRGHIINIGSIAGSLPTQGNVLYSSSKAFLDAYTTALYRETRGTHVNISLVRPGPVRTEFFESARQKRNAFHNPAERAGVSAERVAERIWKLIQRPRRVAHIPAWMSLSPLFEVATGWLQNLIGPVALRWQQHKR